MIVNDVMAQFLAADPQMGNAMAGQTSRAHENIDARGLRVG